MREPIAARILRCALYAGFIAGTAVVTTLPWMLDKYMDILYDAYYLQTSYRTFILVFLEVAGTLGLWVVAELAVILRTVRRDPFVGRNVGALRRVGAAVLIIAALFFMKCVYYVTFLTLVCGIVFLICSLVVFTVGSLFAQAVCYKEDNELTI